MALAKKIHKNPKKDSQTLEMFPFQAPEKKISFWGRSSCSSRQQFDIVNFLGQLPSRWKDIRGYV
jgi:hypothetical protein